MGSLYVNMFLPFRPPCSVRCIVSHRIIYLTEPRQHCRAAPEVGTGVSCHPMTTCLSWSVGSLELEKSLIHSFEDKQV